MKKQEDVTSKALNVDLVEVNKPEVKKEIVMVKDNEELKMIRDKPYKKIFKLGREMFSEIDWEQIPEHRQVELKR
ncbi:hypothetical protein P4159_23900 [Bacillus thuringiensis]|nr:hypothetical protein [Bacillus thuringiensis]MDA2526100.1 hypothetical protein [Bacillus cereus]MEC3597007.1 hypothetical protein [Bacillus thuringiensis]MED1837109.1 hypothetical protein [Bacillus thuringiensis]MED2670940.1 hypothetical protein [Bacillus thuringiensis]MED2716110.1 hypothetical protein [Bacillus thuringiensis]